MSTPRQRDAEEQDSKPLERSSGSRQLMFPGLPERLTTHFDESKLRGLSLRYSALVHDYRHRELAETTTFSQILRLTLERIRLLTSYVQTEVDPISRRFELIEERQSNYEFLLKHAIQPTMRRRSSEIELGYREPDELPAAASAEYEWLSAVRPAIDSVEELIEEFEDLSTRLSLHMKLIKRLQDLLEAARSTKSRYLRSAVLTVYDASRSVYSEDLTAEQVKAIAEAVDSLYSLQWDVDKVQSLDSKLRDVGFETIPSDRFVIAN